VKKKLIPILVAVVVLAAILPGVALAKPNGNGEWDGMKPGTDFNGPHYNLNIIGVPQEKLNGNFDNENRGTIFIPLVTDWWADPCSTTGPNSNKGEAPGYSTTEYPAKGVRLDINVSADDKFHVTDGNATADKVASFEMPGEANAPDGYDVYIAAKGKPNACLDIDAYVFDGTYYIFIAHLDVDRNFKGWHDGRPLLYDNSNNFYADSYQDLFWKLYNNGLRLMQIRFYPRPPSV
jgi:hypothetical protein